MFSDISRSKVIVTDTGAYPRFLATILTDGACFPFERNVDSLNCTSSTEKSYLPITELTAGLSKVDCGVFAGARPNSTMLISANPPPLPAIKSFKLGLEQPNITTANKTVKILIVIEPSKYPKRVVMPARRKKQKA
jgi:hypothetical protein